MSEDRRRRGFRGRELLGAPPRPRRVGEPNVLSDAAIPNRLSTQTGGPAVVRGGPRTGRPNRLESPRVAPRPRRGLPSFSTLIFVGFLAFTALRLVGEFADEFGAGADASPRAVVPGPVTFGTAAGEDCEVTGESTQFTAGTGVWWSAELATEQAPNADATVVFRRDGVEIGREYVPADPSIGSWNLLCASEPIAERSAGAYRVEVWDGDVVVLHAAGEYQVADP